jgi:carboxypeptidase D
MNPDGFALRWRGNANNIDLNRDFPDQVGTPFCCSTSPYASFYCILCDSPFLYPFIWHSHNLQFFSVNNDIDYRQPETKAIMNWVNQEHFTASASLHGVTILTYHIYVILFLLLKWGPKISSWKFQGALVANYPWDGTRDKRWSSLLLTLNLKYFK